MGRLTHAHLALNHRPALIEAAQALAASVTQGLGRELQLDVRCEARLLAAAPLPGTSLAQPAGFALLELSTSGDGALLEIELPFLAALLGRLAGAPGHWTPVSRLTRIEEATFGFVTLLALEEIRRHGGFWSSLGPRLVGLTLQRREALAIVEPQRRHLAIELRLTVDTVRGTARLLLPTSAVRSVLRAEPASLPTHLAPSVAAARVPARCLLGGGRMGSTELARLRPGDVVRFTGTSRSPAGIAGPARLIHERFELTGTLQSEGFRLTGAHLRAFPPEDPMAAVTNPPTIERKDQTELMPALPVDVEVELTRVRLTVGQLAQLRVGHVLPLRMDVSEPVTLRVGDRAVARAELVDIEGELGARILSLVE